MKPSVFLADLRHTYADVLSSDTMPLNIGYMKAVMDRDLPEVQSQLFVYPERLIDALRDSPPDVLMLSNYMWCEQLSLQMARIAKSINPGMLVVMGGPNVSDEPEQQIRYLRSNPQLDLYVLGEGDFLATDIVRIHLDAGLDLSRFAACDVPSTVMRRPDGEFSCHESGKRGRNLDDIPSPWLTGIMDDFFDGRLSPLWETNRGCPFQCTFCVQGTAYYNRVTYFDQNRLHEEIRYIGRMIKERSPAVGMLRIADPNYGMYKRDPEISGYIAETQAEYGWPNYIDATTGKNRPDRIIESLEKVNGALVLWQAVQSMDGDVLRNIQRENIKLEAYESLQIHLRGRGLKSSSDLILGLPGETLRSHVDGLLRIIDSGVMKVNNYQCMMLKGTKMETAEARREYGFKTAFRAITKSFGVYGDRPTFEYDEIVIATATLPFEDYLEARRYHFGCAAFLNHTRFEDLFQLAAQVGIERSEVMVAIFDAMKTDDGVVGALRDAFLAETRGELFESPEALANFYTVPENFARLNNGEIGDNLVAKYQSFAFFQRWVEICRFTFAVTRSLFEARGVTTRIDGFDDLWQDLGTFICNKHAAGNTREDLLGPVVARVSYDLTRWIADGYPLEIEPYRLLADSEAVFELDDQRKQEIAAAIDHWTLSPHGQTMLVKRVRVGGFERRMSVAPGAS